MLATACMTMAAGTGSASNKLDPSQPFGDPIEDVQYYDAEDYSLPPSPGRVLHLSIDYQTIGKYEKGRQDQVSFTSSSNVNAFLADLDYDLLIGKRETFNTLTCALTTVEKMQQLDALQPRLAWKPIDVIKKTLECTTQWGKMATCYPMKKHHVSRFPWNNRKRLREEVGMDTIFSGIPGFDGSTCEQVFFGFVSRMTNVYPMPSKASGHILKAYQDFMRYEGVPECLHRDLSNEQKVASIIDLNRDMRVKDTWSEPDHPNQNFVEALGIKPLKLGAENIMNRTGADPGSWPWVHKYICDINNHCASPFLSWKCPIQVRHGRTPDISAFLQFQFWEKVYFKIDEQHPGSKEAAGYWMGVSDVVGDLMTFDIWSDQTKKVIRRSAVRSADPNRGGIPNLRVQFQEDLIDDEQPELVEPSNILDNPTLLIPPAKPKTNRLGRTNKHKVKWHDARKVEPDHTTSHVEEPVAENEEFHDAQDIPSEFGPKITTDDLSQSHPKRRQKLIRSSRRAHFLTASTCLQLATMKNASGILDTGTSAFHLQDSELITHDPFNPESTHHVLETIVQPDDPSIALSREAFIRKMQVQYFDALEDKDGDDWSFIPTAVTAHKVSYTPRKTIHETNQGPKIKLTRHRHVRVQTCWRSGEVSWVSMDTLKEQNLWVIVNYASRNDLHKHPDFLWTTDFKKLQPHVKTLYHSLQHAAKGHQGMRFKFGVQVPTNTRHAIYLDQIANNKLWQEAIDTELASINGFKTFRFLDEGEKIPPGYARIPYHLIYDVKFDGRRKCRLVCGGHRTPDVPPEEVYSGVVSMDTIRMAFVLAAANGLDVCAADISTAFLYGRTREKVYIVCGEEFGEHAGKKAIVDGSCYGLKSSSSRFHEHLSTRLRAMKFVPSKADFDLWIRDKGDHYEYVATYVDDVLAFSKDPMSIIEELKKTYALKGVEKTRVLLGQ